MIKHDVVIVGAGSTRNIGAYVDGNQVFYGQSSYTDTYSIPLWIGAEDTVSFEVLNGYMDEFRIQKANIFSASPNAGLTDTIAVPATEDASGSTGNMTLVSQSRTAGSQPGEARMLLFEEDQRKTPLQFELMVFLDMLLLSEEFKKIP